MFLSHILSEHHTTISRLCPWCSFWKQGRQAQPTFQGQVLGKERPIGQVQLTGQTVLMFSWSTLSYNFPLFKTAFLHFQLFLLMKQIIRSNIVLYINSFPSSISFFFHGSCFSVLFTRGAEENLCIFFQGIYLFPFTLDLQYIWNF